MLSNPIATLIVRPYFLPMYKDKAFDPLLAHIAGFTYHCVASGGWNTTGTCLYRSSCYIFRSIKPHSEAKEQVGYFKMWLQVINYGVTNP